MRDTTMMNIKQQTNLEKIYQENKIKEEEKRKIQRDFKWKWFKMSFSLFIIFLLFFIGYRIWIDYRVSMEICKIEYEESCKNSAKFYRDVLKLKVPIEISKNICLEMTCKHEYFNRIKLFFGF